QRQMHEQRAVAAELHGKLADGFQEGQRLDVADRAADLHQQHVHVGGRLHDAALDLVGDVRNHLHGGAKVVAAALLLDDVEVNAPGGEIVGAAGTHAHEALVVAEVEVGLGAVMRDEHFAMLERAHGAGIDVDVRVELDHADPQSAGFENGAKRGRGDAFSKGRDHTAGNENEFGHADFRFEGRGQDGPRIGSTSYWNGPGLSMK